MATFEEITPYVYVVMTQTRNGYGSWSTPESDWVGYPNREHAERQARRIQLAHRDTYAYIQPIAIRYPRKAV